ncbi:hypothetical protein QVD17_24321 [Tagetes erecta]|uniref:Uncharacterized protein n=1 Tax=Tagetes erecta TaxID=13708 RepID=A0AAD8KK17_TARER|nr:hypothetical protein QVD17_24321 [Tagetes erecta]
MSKQKIEVDADGFTEVGGKDGARKKGIQVNKQKSRFEYRPVNVKKKMSMGSDVASTSKGLRIRNSFEVLTEVDEGDISGDTEVGDEVTEMADFITKGTSSISEGASTPEASIDEERFLKQKSKVEWLAEGDNNTAFFHKSLKSRNRRSRIDVIMDGGGCIYEGENVQKAFVTHYEKFLGVKGDISLTPTPDLFQKRLDLGTANRMISPITDEELRCDSSCGPKVQFLKEKPKYRGSLFAYQRQKEC